MTQHPEGFVCVCVHGCTLMTQPQVSVAAFRLGQSVSLVARHCKCQADSMNSRILSLLPTWPMKTRNVSYFVISGDANSGPHLHGKCFIHQTSKVY